MANTDIIRDRAYSFRVVTKEGDKYHTPDCPYVKGKEAIELSQEEATENGYAPCKYCVGE